jgi:DNA primase
MQNRGLTREELRELGEEIRRRIDYRSFYLRYCSSARISRGTFRSLCPLPTHNHSGKGAPGLSVDLHQGLFHCFSRDEGGDAIKFYSLMNGISYGRALFELAKELGIKINEAINPHLPFQKKQEEQKEEPQIKRERMIKICENFLRVCRTEEQMEGVNYLERRGISLKAMKRAGIVYFPRRSYHRVMRRLMDNFSLGELQLSGLFNEQGNLTFYLHRLVFPFFVEGRAVYLQARTTASGIEPRWHNLRGNVPALYNADSLNKLASGEIVYLVEGFTDTLTLLTHGFNAVGIVGAAGFKEEWLAPLGRFRVVAALDGDKAGQSAALHYKELFEERGMNLASVNLPSDVNDFFRGNPSAPIEFQLMTEELVNSEW